MNASGASIAWINRGAPGGCWGAPNALTLPADARGLLLAEGVFETVLVLGARPQLLAAHLQRWQRGAAVLGLAPPPEASQIEDLLLQAIARSGIDTGALRLNWCRGSAPRGLAPPEPPGATDSGELFWLQLSAMAPSFEPVRVIVSPSEQRQATSLLSRCKSFGYGSALIARRQAHGAGADDALLTSSAGGLCCGTAANLLIQGDNGWLTPPLSSGCLPGVMRQQAIASGLIRETPISTSDLLASPGALLLNSLGCRPIRSPEVSDPTVESHGTCIGPRATVNPAQAEHFWRRLLEEAGASGPDPGP
jgi:branched-subunit amino acid aminotransferase/4-amino-4-deoxychorismate lyase